jgi:hypothetical protein
MESKDNVSANRLLKEDLSTLLGKVIWGPSVPRDCHFDTAPGPIKNSANTSCTPAAAQKLFTLFVTSSLV